MGTSNRFGRSTMSGEKHTSMPSISIEASTNPSLNSATRKVFKRPKNQDYLGE